MAGCMLKEELLAPERLFMESFLQSSEEDHESSHFTMQAVSFGIHTLIALAIWGGLMAVGYNLQPPAVSQGTILLASMLVAMLAGHIVCRIKPSEMASGVWLLGLIWFLVMSLYVLDLPTGPNACNQCQASEKLTRTFFSFPMPGGLMDDDAPFLVTWPAAALLGYSIGARLAMKRRRNG